MNLIAGMSILIPAPSFAGLLDGPWTTAVRVERATLDSNRAAADLDARLADVGTGWFATRGGTTTSGTRIPRAALGAGWEAGRTIARDAGFGPLVRLSAVLPSDLVATADSVGDLGEIGHEDWRVSTAAVGILAGAGWELRRGRWWIGVAALAGSGRAAWSVNVRRRLSDPLNDITEDVTRKFSAAGNGLMTEMDLNLGWTISQSLTAFVSAGWRRSRFRTLVFSRSADRDGDGTDEVVRGDQVNAPDGTRLTLDLGGTRLAAGLRIVLGGR